MPENDFNMRNIKGYRAFFESGESGSEAYGVAIDMLAELEHRGFDVEFEDKVKGDVNQQPWSFFEIIIMKSKEHRFIRFFSLEEIAPELQQLSLYLIDEMGCEIGISGSTAVKWVSICELGDRPSLLGESVNFTKLMVTIDARK